MNIGDKVTITTVLPLKDGGKFKRLPVDFRYWKTEQIGNTEVHRMNKITIPPKEGIFIGMTKKKLYRYFDISPVKKPHFSGVRRVFMDEPDEQNFEATVEDDRLYFRTKRLDNKWKLDKVAIIATSKCRRYYVALSDLIGPEIKII